MNRFRLTLLLALAAPAVMAQTGSNVPDWARNAVWYQIFPERFANGDPTNDPTRERIGAEAGWSVSEWTGDWYARTAWEQKQGPRFRDFVFDRRYGGDLQGVREKLDYLKALGVTAIYFNPIFDAVSLHKYDASYYHHIDRHFGPNPAADERQIAAENPGDPNTWGWTSADTLFLGLIRDAHARGMKVIVDGVFNHTGRDFWAFQDLLRNKRNSPYAEWYDVTEWNDSLPDGFDYRGWWGYKPLPEFRETDGNLHPGIRQHIFAITRRWMDPNGDGDPSDGVDGWRLDVAEEVGIPFWREWHALVKQINPQAVTVAEIWGDAARHYIADDLFGVVMNYRVANAAHDFFLTGRRDATSFSQRLDSLRTDFPTPVNEAMQNLYDSHDTERLASMVVNRTRVYKESSKIETPENTYEVRAPDAEEWTILKLMAAFQFSYVGAPMVYYGTEAGMWGADDPDDRKPMPWPGMTFDDEVNHPFSHRRPADPVAFNADLHAFYTTLLGIRNRTEALRTGTLVPLVAEGDVYAFARESRTQLVLVAFNRSSESRTVRFDLARWRTLPRRWTDALSGATVSRDGKTAFSVQLAPYQALILIP